MSLRFTELIVNYRNEMELSLRFSGFPKPVKESEHRLLALFTITLLPTIQFGGMVQNAQKQNPAPAASGPAITLIQLSYLAKLAPVTGTYKNNF